MRPRERQAKRKEREKEEKKGKKGGLHPNEEAGVYTFEAPQKKVKRLIGVTPRSIEVGGGQGRVPGESASALPIGQDVRRAS